VVDGSISAGPGGSGHAELAADATRRRRLDLLVARNGCPLAVGRVLPQLVAGRLSSKSAAVLREVAFEVALLHAAISTGSTSAHPVAGIGSPRSRRSSSTSSMASRT